MHWLLHILGIDTQQSYAYDAWSGCIPALLTSTTIGAASFAVLRRHNCHQHRCWRLARHPVEGTPVVTCRRHHPVLGAHPKLTAEKILHLHREAAGREP